MGDAESDSSSSRSASIADTATRATAIQLVIYALGLAGSVLVSRALGPAGRGLYYVPTMAVTVTFAVVHLSVELANTYLFAERIHPLRTLARATATAALLLGPAGVVLLLAVYALGHKSIFAGVPLGYIAIAAAAVPLMLHSTWMSHIFMLAKRLPRSLSALLIGAVVQTAGIVGLYFSGRLDVFAVLLLYVANYAASWALHAWWSWSFAPPVPTFRLRIVADVLRHGARMHLGFVGYTILLRGDIFLVNAFLGATAVGIYSVAVLFADFIWLVSQPMATAALPFQSERSVEDAAAITLRTAKICLLITAGLGLAMAATLWLFLPLFYGNDFSYAYVVLLALLPGVSMVAVVRPLWNWLLRQGRPWLITGLVGAAIVLNVALNAVLLPTVGVIGASIACTGAYVLIGGGLAIWAVKVAGTDLRALIPGPADLRAVAAVLARFTGASRRRA
jgi:O-antigen/teichoic acid export membrane protein